MQLLESNTNTTMSSLAIAELVESNHADVRRSIERLAEKSIISLPPSAEVKIQRERREETVGVYHLCKRDSIIVVAQLCPEFTARLVDRWQELEAQQSTFKVPQTLSEALRLAADQQDTIVAQTLQLEAQAPAVAFVQKFVEAKSSKCLSDVAKILGKKPMAFINQLSDDQVIFKRNGSWIPYQTQLDAGRFTVKTGESSGHAYEQTRVEPKGIEWLAKIYG